MPLGGTIPTYAPPTKAPKAPAAPKPRQGTGPVGPQGPSTPGPIGPQGPSKTGPMGPQGPARGIPTTTAPVAATTPVPAYTAGYDYSVPGDALGGVSSTPLGPRQGVFANADFSNPFIAQYAAAWQDQQANRETGAGLDRAYAGNVFADNTATLNTSHANDLTRLANSEYRDITLGREGNAIDRTLLGQQGDIARRQFGADNARIAQMLGYTDKDAAFIGEQFNNTGARAALARSVADRGNLSTATAQGSITSQGYTQNSRDILGQYRNSMNDATLTRDQAAVGVDRDRDALNKQSTDAALSYEAGNASRGAQAGKLNLADKTLDSIAKDYGANRSDIENAFQSATSKMGLDYDKTITDINQMLGSGNAADTANAVAFMQQMVTMADGGKVIPPTLPNPVGAGGPTTRGSSSGGGGGGFGAR